MRLGVGLLTLLTISYDEAMIWCDERVMNWEGMGLYSTLAVPTSRLVLQPVEHKVLNVRFMGAHRL